MPSARVVAKDRDALTKHIRRAQAAHRAGYELGAGPRKGQPGELVRVATKVAVWLEQLADAAEGRATDTADRFPALSDANRADARNYRAVARDLRRALAAEDRT